MCTGFKCHCNGNSVYICAGCRFTAKGSSMHRYRRPGHKDVYKINRTMTCPHCGNQMEHKGTKFRPPRKTKLNAWKRLGYGSSHVEIPVDRYECKDERALRYLARKTRLATNIKGNIL